MKKNICQSCRGSGSIDNEWDIHYSGSLSFQERDDDYTTDNPCKKCQGTGEMDPVEFKQLMVKETVDWLAFCMAVDIVNTQIKDKPYSKVIRTCKYFDSKYEEMKEFVRTRLNKMPGKFEVLVAWAEEIYEPDLEMD